MRTTPYAEIDTVDQYDVIWNAPSEDASGSMPLGNGEVGINLWVEDDLLFYIGRTDAWSENARLLKLGRVRVKLSPNPFVEAKDFLQRLQLSNGEIEVGAGGCQIRVWVDAFEPVVRLEVQCEQGVEVEVSLEVWRDQERQLQGEELHSAYGLCQAPFPVMVSPDAVVPAMVDRIVWFHRNESSVWPQVMETQGLAEWAGEEEDPLIYRTFGGLIRGEGLVSVDEKTLRSKVPLRTTQISFYTHTEQTSSALDWIKGLGQEVARMDFRSVGEAREAHQTWWQMFWERSWLRLGGTAEAQAVSQAYALQRFVGACGGRGSFPIKFNGSIFTVEAHGDGVDFDADFRRWGGPYWFQNTRLLYWPMLAAGDFDLMEALFHMYREALPLARQRTQVYFGHEGAFFPETMYFWGAYATDNYGWERQDKAAGQVDNAYIRHYWQAGLELVALMLDYYDHLDDEDFVGEVLLPVAEAVIAFYDAHFSRDDQGFVRLEPAQSLETDQQVVNPLPDIAGLHWVLERLLSLSDFQLDGQLRHRWAHLAGALPPIPVGEVEGEAVLLSAAEILEEAKNSENPELYAIFPYRHFGVGDDDLEMARRSFARRRFKGFNGWRQDDIQAALLGLVEDARQGVVERLTAVPENSRFPVFWGPNFDWIPDQTHGSNGMMALQSMLLQTDGARILLFPAWPAAWDVEFKLHAPGNTTIEGVYQEGKITKLVVLPPEREQDVVLCGPEG